MATKSGGSSSGSRSRSSKGPRGGTKSAGSKRAKSGGSQRAKSADARADKSVEAFRDALERSVTLSRDTVAGRRRRRREARPHHPRRRQRAGLEPRHSQPSLLRRPRQGARAACSTRPGASWNLELQPARRRATASARRAARAARDAADAPLAQADRLRRRSGVSAGAPITAYDQLTANQVKSRLGDLTPADLRKVRTQENRGKARKGVLDDIDRRLNKKT